MQIVKLSVEHLEQILTLFEEQFKSEAWSREQIQSSLLTSTTSFYGIFAGQELVCVASILQSIDDINLLDIATKNEYKRKGYAKHMLNFLLGLKKDNQTFSLEVKSKNLPAIKLYESFGFKTLNIRKNYYKDGDNALCMFLEC